MKKQECNTYLGDCLDVMRYLHRIQKKQVDVILTDPPYGIDFQSNRPRAKDAADKKEKILNDKTPFVWWLQDAYDILKPGGRLLCFTRWDVEHEFINAMKLAGFDVKSQIIWDKMHHGMGDLKAAYAPAHENIIYATKGRYEFTGKRPTSVIECPRVPATQLCHPNEKPLALYSQLLLPISNKGETVLDPFMGTANSGIAAMEAGLHYEGIELDEKYYNLSVEKLQSYGKAKDV